MFQSSLLEAHPGEPKEITFFLVGFHQEEDRRFRCHFRVGERRDSILSCLRRPMCRIALPFQIGPVGGQVEATVQRKHDQREGWLTFEILEATIHALRGQIFFIPLTQEAQIAQSREFASEDGTMWP